MFNTVEYYSHENDTTVWHEDFYGISFLIDWENGRVIDYDSDYEEDCSYNLF